MAKAWQSKALANVRPVYPGLAATFTCGTNLRAKEEVVIYQPPCGWSLRLLTIGSIALQHGLNRGDRIRTCDILLPKQARYQTALHPGETSIGLGRLRQGRWPGVALPWTGRRLVA